MVTENVRSKFSTKDGESSLDTMTDLFQGRPTGDSVDTRVRSSAKLWVRDEDGGTGNHGCEEVHSGAMQEE